MESEIIEVSNLLTLYLIKKDIKKASEIRLYLNHLIDAELKKRRKAYE